jgi:hypothetical protein
VIALNAVIGFLCSIFFTPLPFTPPIDVGFKILIVDTSQHKLIIYLEKVSSDLDSKLIQSSVKAESTTCFILIDGFSK